MFAGDMGSRAVNAGRLLVAIAATAAVLAIARRPAPWAAAAARSGGGKARASAPMVLSAASEPCALAPFAEPCAPSLEHNVSADPLTQFRSVIVVTAHPDDESLASGLIARFTGAGAKVRRRGHGLPGRRSSRTGRRLSLSFSPMETRARAC